MVILEDQTNILIFFCQYDNPSLHCITWNQIDTSVCKTPEIVIHSKMHLLSHVCNIINHPDAGMLPLLPTGFSHKVCKYTEFRLTGDSYISVFPSEHCQQPTVISQPSLCTLIFPPSSLPFHHAQHQPPQKSYIFFMRCVACVSGRNLNISGTQIFQGFKWKQQMWLCCTWLISSIPLLANSKTSSLAWTTVVMVFFGRERG